MPRPRSRRAVLRSACTATALVSGCATLGSERSAERTGSTPSSDEMAAYGCPPYESDAETVCSQTVDADSAPVYLLPSPTVGESAATLELVLSNASETDLTFNPYSWTIRTKGTSGWEEIEQLSSGSGKLTLAPGDTQTWTFEEVVRSVNESVPLDSGTYTAAVDVPDPRGDDWLSCLAVFGLR